ncbi:MAG TPA: hypothetical protein VHH32_07125 [Gemmatimonadales bacterium]|nr:hypothetical protein [Gemmatimonadales bacterium]
MASPSARLASAGLTALCFVGLGCVEGGALAVSAGAPVTAAVRGRVTDCGRPVAGAEVVLRVQQNLAEQARPVDASIGPLTTARDGSYFAEVGPPFAVPGRADVQLTVAAAGITVEHEDARLRFTIGTPARDTLRIDTDLAVHRGFCID